jgi:hypothetical protein
VLVRPNADSPSLHTSLSPRPGVRRTLSSAASRQRCRRSSAATHC